MLAIAEADIYVIIVIRYVRAISVIAIVWAFIDFDFWTVSFEVVDRFRITKFANFDSKSPSVIFKLSGFL